MIKCVHTARWREDGGNIQNPAGTSLFWDDESLFAVDDNQDVTLNQTMRVTAARECDAAGGGTWNLHMLVDGRGTAGTTAFRRGQLLLSWTRIA